MARILNNSDMKEISTVSNLKFSGVRVAKLGATEYTLVTICIDMSASVRGFKAQLIECIQNIIGACKQSPRSSYLLVRVISFNYGVYEEHGFINLGNIDDKTYSVMVNPEGMTALYDATVNAIESTGAYSQQLDAEEIDVNGIIFVITDGYNNMGTHKSPQAINDAMNAIKRSESLESLQLFLIGVNNDDAFFAKDLKKLTIDAQFDGFIDASDSTPDTLAKLAQFVSKSISNQSEALGTGGPSQVIASF